MILTTTNNIENKQIQNYLGLVSGETIIGANFIKDFMSSITDIIGGRSSSYEKVLVEAKEIALKEMQDKAQKLGANAIVGIDLDYASVGKAGGMLMVTVTGTAVVVS